MEDLKVNLINKLINNPIIKNTDVYTYYTIMPRSGQSVSELGRNP